MQIEEHQLNEVYTLGSAGFAKLVAGFYAQIPADPILAPMYPEDDLEGAEQRLRDFLIFRFGGPDDYIQQRGHPRLRGRHMPFKIDRVARDRWMQLMQASCAALDLSPAHREVLLGFLGMIATFLINRETA